MSPSIRTRSIASVALVLAAACNETSAPTFSDPDGLNTDIQFVGESFAAPTFSSYSELSSYMAPPGSPLPAILRSLSPEPMARGDRPRSLQAARTLRAFIPQLSGPQAGPIIPDELYGKSYEWDESLDEYVESVTPSGPANGVRFYLYAIDPFTDLPATPLNQVGYVDLMDESASPTALALHIQVVSSTTTIHADQVVTVTAGIGAFTATSSGFVTNGLSGTAERRLTFDIAFAATETATTADLSADATFTVPNRNVSLEVHDDVHFNETDGSVRFERDFAFQRPGETVTLEGDVTITDGTTLTIVGQIAILINGRVFVSVTWTSNQPRISRELTDAEEELILNLLESTDTVWSAIEGFFNPALFFST